MDEEIAVVRKDLLDHDQALAKELDESGTGQLVGVRKFVLLTAKFATGGKRRIDVAQPYAWRAVCIHQIASLLHVEESPENLQVVAEYELVGPIRGRLAETAQLLQRNAHRRREDAPAALLPGVGQL